MEQRRFPRYKLATPLTGVVEHEGGRCTGSVLNISTGGFYLYLAKPPENGFKTKGANDYGEIHYAARIASGFGNLVRVENFIQGVGIGFSWDNDGMDEASALLIDDLIKDQESKRELGRVMARGSEIALSGHVSSALSSDVFSCLRSIGAGKARLSLSECTSLDSSGIELLMTLRDRNVPIINPAPEVEAILQRFQLLVTATDKNSSDA